MADRRIGLRAYLLAALLLLLLLVSPGCERETIPGVNKELKAGSPNEVTKTSDTAQTQKAEANYIVGRVMMEDGKPLRGDVREVAIWIEGVSEAGERIQYAPAVNADGTYRQKVSGGQYKFSGGRIIVGFNNVELPLPLEPVGQLWSKQRGAEDGIVQDFVWKITGPTPYGKANGLKPSNATHWYGMSVGMRADGFRNDINKAPTAIPEGTKLIFTLKPTSSAIDGSELKPFTIERIYSPTALANPDLNDLPPASYELSGVATLPDGRQTPLLLQGMGDYPGYKQVINLAVGRDEILNTLMKPPCSFVIE